MPTRTHTAEQAGAIVFDVALTAGAIRVTVEDRPSAEVTVSTEQDSGPAADMVQAATFTERPGRLAVRVPDAPATISGGTVHVSRGGRTVISTGSVFNAGVLMFGSGVVVNGGAVVGGVVVGSPVTIDVRLPLGSTLVGKTTAADVETYGELAAADVETISGALSIDTVAQPRLRSTSGDIRIARLTGDGRLRTVSGDVRVHAAVECSLSAQSVSGDIRVSGARVDLDASSVSGRITTR